MLHHEPDGEAHHAQLALALALLAAAILLAGAALGA